MFRGKAFTTLVCCLTISVVLGASVIAECVAIKDRVLTYAPGRFLAGQLLETRYDDFGYNYQAHMFNGSYFNAYANGAGFPPYEGDDVAYCDEAEANCGEQGGADSHWAWPYRNITLQMKWNDAWLSNKDCDGDGSLDRHYGYESYVGSGAWLTNHQSGSDTINIDGKDKTVHWNYFVKIVAVPSDAHMGVETDGEDPTKWYGADGVEIGAAIWGSFAIIQQVYNDPIEGVHGRQYLSPSGAGFGKFSPHE